MIERRLPPPRNPQRGSVAFMVAILYTALFGMAALAVDAGHMYLTKRNVQEVADAAVMAGLPSLANSTAIAQTNASLMAQKSGYAVGNISTSTGTAGGLRTLSVTITATETFFFAKVLHFSSKTVSATSVGQTNDLAPAVLALGTTCSGTPAPVGVQFNGGPVTVNGNVEGNGPVNAYGTTTVTGTTAYGSGAGCSSNIGGASNSGGSITDPFNYPMTNAFWGSCDFGSLTTAGTLSLGGPGAWWASGSVSGPGTLATGVYCANGNIDLSGGTNITGTVTLVATGAITISGSTIHLTAASNGVIAYSGATSNCYSSQAINVGSSAVTLDGDLYAPHGCINSSGASVVINGSEIGNEVQVGVGLGSSLGSTAGGSTQYRLYQ